MYKALPLQDNILFTISNESNLYDFTVIYFAKLIFNTYDFFYCNYYLQTVYDKALSISSLRHGNV